MIINRYMLTLFAALSSCAHRAAPPPSPGPVTFTIGNPYQAGGEWRYPREFNNYDVTGLSTIIPDSVPRYTANNELYDPEALAAASPVLQLPCIVTITNLVTGQSVDVRVNDRGPMQSGRVIAVTPRVARLLDYPSGGVVEVEVKLNVAATAALESSLGAGPKMSAAPVASITAQSLAAPGTTSGGSAMQQLGPSANASQLNQSVTLSGTVSQGQPAPGPLWVQIAGFGAESDAFRTMAKLYGMPARVVPVQGEDRTLWAVNVGPYHSVADADAALKQVLQDGLAAPEIIVR
jgi:rare lipoprotein A